MQHLTKSARRPFALGAAAIAVACGPHSQAQLPSSKLPDNRNSAADNIPVVTISVDPNVEFRPFTLGEFVPWRASDFDVQSLLPGPLRAQLDTVTSARDELRRRDRKAKILEESFRECGACADGRNLESRLRAAQSSASQARDELRAAIGSAETSMANELSMHRGSPAVAIALARLRHRGASLLDVSGGPILLRYAVPAAASPPPGVTAPLEEAAAHVPASARLGRWLRMELIEYLIGTPRATDATMWIEDLHAEPETEWPAELAFFSGVVAARRGEDARAADRFHEALGKLTTHSFLPAHVIMTAELAARYRARQFEKALEIAIRILEHHRGSSLRMHLRLKVITWALFDGVGTDAVPYIRGISTDSVVKLAADAVEQLQIDPVQIAAPPEIRARILSRIALRALYRHDVERARKYADLARPEGESLYVLAVLADRSGNTALTTQLGQESIALRSSYAHFLEPNGRSREPDHDVIRFGPQLAGEDPPAANNARSLLRLCLEPLGGVGVESGDNALVSFNMSAIARPGGTIAMRTTAPKNIEACLLRLGPSVFAHSPSSIVAHVVVQRGAAPSGAAALQDLSDAVRGE